MSEWGAVLLATGSAGLLHAGRHNSPRARVIGTAASAGCGALAVTVLSAVHPVAGSWLVLPVSTWTMGFVCFVLARPFAPLRIDVLAIAMALTGAVLTAWAWGSSHAA
ncbi:MAG: hypothetical protein KUG77_26460 [Nannocystaceae bacterium]|nr:hypothetical protein [Nannocystaceae bacterium]